MRKVKKKKNKDKKDRTQVAQYNKERECLLRVSTGLEGWNRGENNRWEI